MFCPVCKSEYREGFTKCSDCDVDLVRQLAEDSEAKASLWAGQDASVRSAICEKLDAAKILHEDDSVESQFMPAFRQSIYRIQVRKKDHEAALNAICEVDVDRLAIRPSPGVILDRNSDWLRTTLRLRTLLTTPRLPQTLTPPAMKTSRRKKFPTISSRISTRTTPHRKFGPVQMAAWHKASTCVCAKWASDVSSMSPVGTSGFVLSPQPKPAPRKSFAKSSS